MSLLEEAYKALEESKREFQRYIETKERVTLRDSCEKAWMATFLATDHLLVSHGFEKPKSGDERRRELVELEKKIPEAKQLGLRDRFGSRAYHLHSIGFYEGWLEEEEFKLEIEKVEEYLEIIKRLSEGRTRQPMNQHLKRTTLDSQNQFSKKLYFSMNTSMLSGCHGMRGGYQIQG